MAEQQYLGLVGGFLESSRRFPSRLALEVEGEKLTYEELSDLAFGITGALRLLPEPAPSGLVAVLAHRSCVAFSGILGTLLNGTAYLPLGPDFPAERIANVLARTRVTTVIVDADGMAALERALDAGHGTTHVSTVIAPHLPDVSELRSRFPNLTILGASDLVSPVDKTPTSRRPDDLAYVLFTSGSTGTPKGVCVTHANAVSFIDEMVDRFDLSEKDRFSQAFELVFDVSVWDMFVTWRVGGCLCCPSRMELLFPGRYIESAKLTVWYSVPSMISLMRGFRMLEPDAYPSLRYGLFAGEALLEGLVSDFGRAAPNATIENLYGPTEMTVTVTAYRWDPERSPAECEDGLVPIGRPNTRMRAVVVDGDLREVPESEVGELLMSGPQVTAGYWEAPELTNAAFIRLEGHDGVFYRSGDRVRRPVGDGPIMYLGRMDSQLQVHGHRVEIGEVEAALREVSGETSAIVVGVGVQAGRANHLAAFIEADTVDEAAVREGLTTRLPAYMVPKSITALSRLPVSPNGKTDRNALQLLADDDA